MAERFYFRPLRDGSADYEVVDGATVIGTIKKVDLGDRKAWRTKDRYGQSIHPMPKTKGAAALVLSNRAK